MFAKFRITPPFPSNTTADVRVKLGDNVIATRTAVNLSGAEPVVTGIATSSPIETKVRKTTPTFTWEISLDSGNNWLPAGNSGPHTLYWAYANPWTPPFQDKDGTNYGKVFDLAFEKSCGKLSGSGSTDISTIASQISNGIDADIVYNPSRNISQHPLNAYGAGTQGCECANHGFLLAGLLNTIGILGKVRWVFGGSSNTKLLRYQVRSSFPPNTGVSFYVVRASHDLAQTNPHFRYHIVTTADVGATLYDPSYGMQYSEASLRAAITEVAGGAPPSANANVRITTAKWIDDDYLAWLCAH